MAPDLPLFPLHTVLFPGGRLPLQIFEVRYLDLMRRCEKSGEPFGIVCLESGDEVRRAPRADQMQAQAPSETFAKVGTLATLAQVEHPRPGLMFVLVEGGQRFEIEQTQLLPHGLWTALVRLIPDDLPAPLPVEHAALPGRLQRLLRAMAEDGLEPGPPPPSPDNPCWLDAGWLANRWAERLPLPADERQRMMSLDNPLWRLDLVAEWLGRLAQMDRGGDPRRPIS